VSLCLFVTYYFIDSASHKRKASVCICILLECACRILITDYLLQSLWFLLIHFRSCLKWYSHLFHYHFALQTLRLKHAAIYSHKTVFKLTTKASTAASSFYLGNVVFTAHHLYRHTLTASPNILRLFKMPQ
jgi:hypothetical protein